MKIKRNENNSLVTKCLEYLEQNIIEGTFLPGTKLKVAELKEVLNTGQSPIREALSRLTESGLVEAEENKGFRVAEISEEDVRDIYRVMFDIEMLALKKAIAYGDDSWEANIVAALHQLARIETRNEPVAYAEWVKRNYAFHVALISGCNSPTLLELRALVYKRFDRYCRMAFNLAQHSLELNHEEHKKIADAVLKRDLKKIQELMRHHIFGAMEEVIATLKINKLL